MNLNSVLELITQFVPLLGVAVTSVVLLALLNRVLRRRWRDSAEKQFRFQLIMLALSLAAIVAVIIALPIDDVLRGQLLSLLGILLSAAIALASTTFIGNVMAGIMLKVVGSARPGDFVTVSDLTGRITEMGLLHTEVQTEFRDLVTIPNLYLVTQPLKVVRASGTIVSAEVSIGYEVPHADVSDVLREAALSAELKDPFVHVRELGDYSVLYRVAGLLEDVRSLISARSRLRESMLDALHAANIEIVSPTFMNSRVYSVDREFIPEPARRTGQAAQGQAEDVAFDKASEAASAEELRQEIERIDKEISALSEDADARNSGAVERLETRKASLLARLERQQEQLAADEIKSP